MVSTAGTGHYYTTTKNKRTHPEKMEMKKYDPVIKKHVNYKESKNKILAELFMPELPEVETTVNAISGNLKTKNKISKGISA